MPLIILIFIWSIFEISLEEFTRHDHDAVVPDSQTSADGEGSENMKPWSVHFAYNVVLGMSLCTYVLVGFYSIIFAYRRLARPGVSVEMRMLFLKKHAIYVIVLIFIWITSLISNYLDSLSLGPSYKGNTDNKKTVANPS